MLANRKIDNLGAVVLISLALASCSQKVEASQNEYVSGNDYSGMKVTDFQNIVSSYSYCNQLSLWTKKRDVFPDTPLDPKGNSPFSQSFEDVGFTAFNCESKTVFGLFDEKNEVIEKVIETDRIYLTKSRCDTIGLIGDFEDSLSLRFQIRTVNLNYRKSSLSFSLDYSFLKQFGAFDSAVIWPYYDYKTFDDGIGFRSQHMKYDMLYYVPAYTIYSDDLSEVYGVLTFDENGYARTFLKEDGCSEPIQLYDFYKRLETLSLDVDRCVFYLTSNDFKPGWWELAINRKLYPKQKETFQIQSGKYIYKYTYDEGNNSFLEERIDVDG